MLSTIITSSPCRERMPRWHAAGSTSRVGAWARRLGSARYAQGVHQRTVRKFYLLIRPDLLAAAQPAVHRHIVFVQMTAREPFASPRKSLLCCPRRWTID